MISDENEPSTTSIPRRKGVTPASSASKQGKRHKRNWRRSVKRLAKKIRWQYLLILCIALLALAGVGSLALVTDANARVQGSWSELQRILTTTAGGAYSDLKTDDFDRLNFALKNLTDTLETAQNQVGVFRFLSPIRKDIGATIETLTIAREVAYGASDMLSGMQPMIYFLLQLNSNQNTSTFQSSAGARAVELLRLGQGSLLNARNHFQSADERIKSLRMEDVPSSLVLTVQELISYEAELRNANTILLNTPDLLTKAMGLDDPQTYLVLAQNSDELRPSGGYISTYGWLSMRRLKITDFDYQPTSDKSPLPPPAALANNITVPAWWIQREKPIYTAWDGSWYADFPSTAKMAAWFYDNGQNPHAPVDGVIAIDIYGFEAILQGFGSITVPGYNQVVTPANFREVVYQIRASDEPDAPHKRFLAAFYKELFKQWQSVSPENSTAVFNAVFRALREKHIMLYFTESKLNDAIDLLGWSGKQDAATDHDYLMVADTNMGSKSNRSITRQLTYDVQIQSDNAVQSRTSIEYDFPASVAMKDPGFNLKNYTDINYFNTLQVFAPVGSKITATRNLQARVNTVTMPGYVDFVTLTKVDYDGTERFQFSYTTPAIVQKFGNYWRYRLLLQKQPGTVGDSVNVQITLPKNASVIKTSPEVAATYNLGQPILEFRTQLTTDQWIQVVFSK